MALCAGVTHSPSEQGWGLLTSIQLFLLQALLQGRVLGLSLKPGGAGEWVLCLPHAQPLHGSLGCHPWLSASPGGSVSLPCWGQRLCLLWHRGGVRGRGDSVPAPPPGRAPRAALAEAAAGTRGQAVPRRQLTFWKEIAPLCSFL